MLLINKPSPCPLFSTLAMLVVLWVTMVLPHCDSCFSWNPTVFLSLYSRRVSLHTICQLCGFSIPRLESLVLSCGFSIPRLESLVFRTFFFSSFQNNTKQYFAHVLSSHHMAVFLEFYYRLWQGSLNYNIWIASKLLYFFQVVKL
jgi:hypothetical protein